MTRRGLAAGLAAVLVVVCVHAGTVAARHARPASRSAWQDVSTSTLFDRAEAASTGRNLRMARDLYRQAAEKDPDPIRRDRAAIRAAAIDWHVFLDARAARTWLARVADSSREASNAWRERALLELELTRDYAAARAAAKDALTRARTLVEREAALIADARAVMTPARDARLKGICPNDLESLRAAMGSLRTAIDAGGPVLESSRLLFNAALMTGDRETRLQALRWYFADTPSVLPAEMPGDRRSLGLALAAMKLFPESELVFRNACEREAVNADTAVRDVLAYAGSLERLGRLTSEHFRAVAHGKENDSAFENAVQAEARALWKTLSWPEEPPPFSNEAFRDETARRFGTVASLGNTDGVRTLLLGHALLDERREVEQYGQRAPLRFVLLDGIVSSGYLSWLTRQRSGTGGWIGADAIYQIRPAYADGPVNRWRRLTDPELRARRDEEIATETKRDVDRAKESPIRFFRGLDLRLRLQADEQVQTQLTAEGLSGDALRDGFIRRARLDVFDSSIWAHEGRHAIDKLIFKINDSPELEFRAKISEVAFARTPRSALASLLSPIGPPTAHGIANQRLWEGVTAWMRAHAAEIAALDVNVPLLPQLDKLTDDQLRAAFRSLDPLAK